MYTFADFEQVIIKISHFADFEQVIIKISHFANFEQVIIKISHFAVFEQVIIKISHFADFEQVIIKISHFADFEQEQNSLGRNRIPRHFLRPLPCVTSTPPQLLRPVRVSTGSELYPNTQFF